MTWFRWICQRCDNHFHATTIATTCAECSPLPFEMSGS